PLEDDDRALIAESGERRILVASKADLPPAWDDADAGALPVSSLTDEGIADLRARLAAPAVEDRRDRPALANLRHAGLLSQARDAIRRACASATDGVPEEFVLADIHDARSAFDEVTGARPQDEVLRTIFERFCIGK